MQIINDNCHLDGVQLVIRLVPAGANVDQGETTINRHDSNANMACFLRGEMHVDVWDR